MNKLKELFCKHEYQCIMWRCRYDKKRNERYSVRLYRCNKCQKQKWVDGRTGRVSKERF